MNVSKIFLFRFVNNRKTGKRRTLQKLVELPDGCAGTNRMYHSARRHNVFDADFLQVDNVADNAVFIVVQNFFVTSHFGQRLNFVLNVGSVFGTPEHSHNETGYIKKRAQQNNHDTQGNAHRRHQLTPVFGTDGFRQNFRKDQNCQGHNAGGKAKVGLAVHGCNLGTDAGGADRMSNGVKRKNGGQRRIYVLFKGIDLFEPFWVFFFKLGNKTWGNGQ